MNELRGKITQLLDKFAQQEIGNRLSEFSMIALKNMILTKFVEYEKREIESETDGVQKENHNPGVPGN